MDGDMCSKIATIPQYESTCWFNSILMSILYSENSRKLLLYENNATKHNKNNRLLAIVNKIIYSIYLDKSKAQEYFNIFRPEVILSYLKGMNNHDLYHIVYTGWFSNIFLFKFIENIGRSCIVLDYYKNKFYAGITQSTDIDLNDENYIKFKYTAPEIKEIIKLNKNPDYIYVNVWNVFDVHSSPIISTIFKNYEKHKKAELLLNTYGFEYSRLDTFEDTIEFNGYTYKLDSCSISNYNQHRTGYGHEITGITCGNNKYVYNGWLKSTNDRGLTQSGNDTPCNLIKYDWDIKKDDDRGVCIDLPNCTLRTIKGQRDEKKQNMCFSFNIKRGKNVLVYVRTTPLNKQDLYISDYETKTITSISSQRSLNSIVPIPSISQPSYISSVSYNTGDNSETIYRKEVIKYNEVYGEKLQKKKEELYRQLNEKKGLINDKHERKEKKRADIKAKKMISL
jgi:hypothetical protein